MNVRKFELHIVPEVGVYPTRCGELETLQGEAIVIDIVPTLRKDIPPDVPPAPVVNVNEISGFMAFGPGR